MTRPAPAQPWSVPLAIHDVPETGHHVDLTADERTRAAVAKLAGLRALPRLQASFDVTRRGSERLHVAGRVSATVGQTCVVTLEPIDNEVEEAIDLDFAPPPSASAAGDEGAPPAAPADEDAPEPLINGVVDLGAVATEFLMLGLEPYPRKPGAVFEPPPQAGDDSGHPFAPLAALKNKGQGGAGGG